nr:unnamed protein product [Spirometra erinaceieuropaei]
MLQLLNSTDIILPEVDYTTVPLNLRGLQNDYAILTSEKEALESISGNVLNSSSTENGSRRINSGPDSFGTTSFPSFRSRCEATGGFLSATDFADEGTSNPKSVGREFPPDCPQSEFSVPGGDARKNASFLTSKERPDDSSISKWTRGAGVRNKVTNSMGGSSVCGYSGTDMSHPQDYTEPNGSPTKFNWERQPPDARTGTDSVVTADFSKAPQGWVRGPLKADQPHASDRLSRGNGSHFGSVRRPAAVGGESCEVSAVGDHNGWSRPTYNANDGCPSYRPPKFSSQSRCPDSPEGVENFHRSYSAGNYDEWNVDFSDKEGLAPANPVQSCWDHSSDYLQPREESNDLIDQLPPQTKGSTSWDVLSAPKFDCMYGSGGENLPQPGFDRRPTSRGDTYKSEFPSEPPNYYAPPLSRGRGRGGRRGSGYASRLRERVNLR